MLTDSIYHALAPFPKVKRQFARVVRRLPHRQRIVTMRGQKLLVDPSEMSGYYLYYEQEYDDQIFNFLDAIINRYRVVLDIGANIGVYTCYFAARVPEVIAFEPDAAVCDSLRRNLRLNNLGNVTVNQICIGREKGTVKFAAGDSRNSGVGSMIDAPGESLEVPCASLDDLIQQPFGPALIKLDIEGAEWLALQGARRLLSAADSSVDILMEVHPDQLARVGVSLNDLHALIVDMGYRVCGIGENGPASLLPDSGGERFWWISRTLGPEEWQRLQTKTS